MKRIIEFSEPGHIATWSGELGSTWKVVALDVDRGEVHMERVEPLRPVDRMQSAESELFAAAAAAGWNATLKLTRPTRPKATKGRSLASKAPRG